MDITREESVFGLVSDVLMVILLTSVICGPFFLFYFIFALVRFVAKWVVLHAE